MSHSSQDAVCISSTSSRPNFNIPSRYNKLEGRKLITSSCLDDLGRMWMTVNYFGRTSDCKYKDFQLPRNTHILTQNHFGIQKTRLKRHSERTVLLKKDLLLRAGRNDFFLGGGAEVQSSHYLITLCPGILSEGTYSFCKVIHAK